LFSASLADTLGLTAVHVNRVIQSFRREELIRMARGRLTLLDYHKLSEIAEFDGIYLNFEKVAQQTAVYFDSLCEDRLATFR
jgi:hypothetical protein